MMLVFAVHKDGSYYFCFRAPIDFDLEGWVNRRDESAVKLTGITGYYAEILAD